MFTQLTSQTEKNRLINLLAAYGVKHPVISAFEDIPRELFVEKELVQSAYEDRALPIGQGQTISQPSLVSAMLEKLNLRGTEKVLEVGTGSGFETALLSKLASMVYSIERIPSLAKKAASRLKKLKIGNTKVIIGDGTLGLERYAPYDAIIVTAAFKTVPPPLSRQLVEGGRLIMPLGGEKEQEVVLYKKIAGKLVLVHKIAPVRFVPLIGEHAWNIVNGTT